MKSFYTLVLIILSLSVNGQVSLLRIGLEYGPHHVGFSHTTTYDSTRSYNRLFDDTSASYRAIPISIWYPSEVHSDSNMIVLDYIKIMRDEEEWENLPPDQILNWFYYLNTPENQAHLKEESNAKLNAATKKGPFPIIIYAPSFKASSTENFALCEYLASYGFIVMASPSRGTYHNRSFNGNNALDMETQARDVEFLIRKAINNPNVDSDKIALIGFSFGGLSNSLVQMRNDQIKAVLSLDGTERYRHSLLKSSPFYSISRVDVPYMHLAQKDIPDKVLEQDGLHPSINSDFSFYDELLYSEAYSFKLNYLTHSYFSSFGILFEKRDVRQDKDDSELMNSYKWVCLYAQNFLRKILNEEPKAIQFINNTAGENGASKGLILSKSKEPNIKQLSIQDFHRLAKNRKYENLSILYDSLKNSHHLVLHESHLNTLGLKLMLHPQKSLHSIKIFLLAIEIYPESANLYDSLAEAYLINGFNDLAVLSFKKSLELNANNKNAIDRLKQLKTRD